MVDVLDIKQLCFPLLTLPVDLVPPREEPAQSLALHHSTLEYFPHVDEDEEAEVADVDSQSSTYGASAKFQITVVLHDGILARVNNLISYFSASRKVTTHIYSP